MKRGKATIGGFIAIVLWSMTVALVRSLSEDLGPVTSASVVYGIAGSAALFTILRKKSRRREVFTLSKKYLIGCGFLFTCYMLLFSLAVGRAGNRTQVLTVGLLNYLWPVFTLVLSLVLLKKKARWFLLPATLLALAGVFLVVTQGENFAWRSLIGNSSDGLPVYIFALGAAVTWAVYSNLTRRWAAGRKEGAVGLFLPAAAVALFAISCFLDEPRFMSTRTAAEVLVLGASTYAAYTLWDNAMRRGYIILVAAASYLTPLFSTLVTSVYLSVVPGFELWIGCVILILGSAGSWLAIRRDPD
ncbi:MAG: aromatic amino acid DMT transporter YddG [Spirochaetales bacterium]|nr:aromatic amino acid DMT transporter YddG [Spirochaetales bacterium]